MEQQAFSIPEFCTQHGISRSYYFLMRKVGQSPREIRIGRRVLISREAAADWRREREQPVAA